MDMAAYAALCSLRHIVEQIQHHRRPPISLDQQQVESLTENVSYLQEFLEGYSHAGGYTKEADPLESRIADAAHAAEDVIESHIVDQIIHPGAGSRSHGVNISSVEFYEGLRKVIEEMDSIRKEVIGIKEKTGVRDQHHRNSTLPADSSRPSSAEQNTMVGFDDALLEILDKLTRGQSDRQVIPVVGMGGMGKTTLVRNVYANPLIQQYFDVCAWATISQEYDALEILREVLCPGSREELSDVEDFGGKLHKYLSGMRYMIVLDDMWSIEAWDEVRRFFPDSKNGSRIVITTRLSNLASQLTSSYKLEMKFLDNDESCDLLCRTVFGEEGFPFELEEIGKKIVENCRGLPLSIFVTGGLLGKSKHSREYWEYIAENLNSLVNSEDNERCLNILYLSYKQLPVFLKPCFLYMGVFSEDNMIRPGELIRLWVAEGFLKPISGKCLEEIAEGYLKELIDRNLVHASRRIGKIKHCTIHDLLRDLCLREARKERFYNVIKDHSLDHSKGINTQYRVVIPRGTFGKEVIEEFKSMSLARSFISEGRVVPLSLNCRLLRVLHTYKKYKVYSVQPSSLRNMFGFVNSRYFAIHVDCSSEFPSSISHLWNLQTLNVDYIWLVTAPAEIWNMPQLRHVKFVNGLYLPDLPRKDDEIIVLANLQSLSSIVNFKCSEKVIQRIPNIKKLGIRYRKSEGSSHYCLNNLDCLRKLESFDCASYSLRKPKETEFLHMLRFPHSLKKLTLKISYFIWDGMMEKIGSLPLLEVLNLSRGSFNDRVWETVEGQFISLKSLRISSLYDLKRWNSESTHFPCLQQLVLQDLHELKEIPPNIGEIPTLESVELTDCSYSAAISAIKILEEQEEFGDVTLRVQVYHSNKEEREALLKRFASPNFKVQYYNER